MNCKSGDMAIITGSTPDCMGLIGKVVTVTSLVTSRLGDPTWMIEEPIRVAVGGDVGVLTGVEDMFLTPLRGDPKADDEPAQVNIGEAVNLAWGFKPRELA